MYYNFPKIKDPANTFLTSDPHFNHDHHVVLKARGATTREELNDNTIALWNSTVRPDSEVYCLGDLCLHDPDGKVLLRCLKQLNFRRLYVLWGNHNSGIGALYRKALLEFFNGDQRKLKYKVYPLKTSVGGGIDASGKRFSKELIFLGDTHTVLSYNTPVVLFHYAIRNWNLNAAGSLMVCGHSHGNDAYIHPKTGTHRIVDVSMESVGAPISFRQLKGLMDKRSITSSDHHTPGARDNS
jgi:calcineurin-like phosphoesterase family protein